MKIVTIYISIIIFFCFSFALYGQRQDNVFGLQIEVKEKQTGKPIEFALVYLSKDKLHRGGICDENGITTIDKLEKGKYRIEVSLLGYEKWVDEIEMNDDKHLKVLLSSNLTQLNEIVVTASESRGLTSSSIIDRNAMQHLQPSSFTDLLELLPGGKSHDPNFGSINTIRIREVGMSDTNDKYNISSLGVSFVIDGAPISTDANMQYLSGHGGTSSMNKGVDMRSISTDQIERVEIVRGIPSVQYGDLTSGLVKIERKKGETPWRTRLKVDGYSKLVALDKGFSLNDKKLTFNFGVDFLDSKSDPTNSYSGYQRLSYSMRLSKIWDKESYSLNWQSNFDHGHTFDDIKTDPNIYDDVQEGADVESLKKNRYKSKYDRLSLSNNFVFTPKEISFLKSVDFKTSVAYELAKIEQVKFVQQGTIALTTLTSDEGGIADGIFLPSKYLTYNNRDGKPLNIFLQGQANFEFSTASINHKAIFGGEYTFDKNYGKGIIIDRYRPVGEGVMRPRKFSDIPSKQNLNFYIGDDISMPIADNIFKLSAGLRGMSMIGMDSQYKMSGKLYFDPRLNAEWSFPAIAIKKKDLNVSISGGIGWHTKFPTLDQIYPDYVYIDKVRLNYYDPDNLEQSRVNYQTFRNKTINYDLDPARNLKWEVRLNLEYDNNKLSVTYFRERMKNGFRLIMMDILSTSYNRYYEGKDEVVINPITNQPDLDRTPYKVWRELFVSEAVGNGSEIDKEGIEYTFSTRRFEAIKTRITINGAWFKTRYLNSHSMYLKESKTLNREKRQAVGIYDHSGGDYREQFNSNLMFDTYIPSLGFEFSTSFQCKWFSTSQELPVSRYPQSYIDEYGVEHAYTEVEQNDSFLMQLMRESNPGKFRKKRIPLGMDINLKASKKIKDIMRISLFVNKLLDYYPDYKINNAVVKRTVSPYFGMEINITL